MTKMQFSFVLMLVYRTERAAGLFGAAEEKVLVFLRRFNLLRQRISKQLRNGALLLGPSVSSLTPIKSIKGISAPDRVYCVLGALTEMVEGALFLEDPEDSIELDLSQLRDEPDNLVLEGNIVLVRGVCLGKRLLVERLIMPPAEPRAETLAMLTHPDMSEATSFAEPTHELRELEQQAQSARIVVMSDVWLDQPRILERFKMLFDGFNGQGHLPEIFVLIGPFSSNPPKDGPRAWSHYQDLFDNFAALVERVKNARHTRFIFVPGATDPGFAESLLPRNSIPEPIFDAWRRAKLDYVSTTNPCRIIYFTQEIVICRQELTTRMRTCALNGFIRAAAASCEKANSDAEMTACGDENKSAGTLHSLPTHQLAMKAILDQASLVPVAQTTQAHIWSLDHSLALYPIPDLLVVAERQQCHEFTYRDCICANPGAFPSAEGTFFVYNPAKRMLEMSELPG